MVPDKLKQRPENFTLNPESQLARGLVFAGLGKIPKTRRFCDSSPYGNHGVLTNMEPTDWVFDQYLGRWVQDLGGDDEYVATTTAGMVFKNRTTFSVAFWEYSRSIAASNRSILGEASAPLSYTLNGCWIRQNGAGLYLHLDTDSHNAILYDADGMPANVWIHWVWVSGGTYNTHVVYRNGVDVTAAFTNTGTANFAAPTSTNHLMLGKCTVDTFTYDGFWDGYLGDVCIWSRALSGAESQCLADPSNVLLSGLIKPPKRRLYAFPALELTTQKTALSIYGVPGRTRSFLAKSPGGLEDVTGTASQDVSWNESATGTGIIEGSISQDLVWNQALSASIIVTGTASQDLIWNQSATGTIIVSGTISSDLTWDQSATGKVDIAGTASQTLAWDQSLSGEIAGVSAGEISSDLGLDIIGQGRVDIGGSISQDLILNQVGSGTLEISGTISSDLTWNDILSGKVEINGSISSDLAWNQVLSASIIVSGNVSQTLIWDQSITGDLVITGDILSGVSWNQVVNVKQINSGPISSDLTWDQSVTCALDIEGEVSQDVLWNQEVEGSDVKHGPISQSFGVSQEINANLITSGSASSDIVHDSVGFGTIECVGSVVSSIKWDHSSTGLTSIFGTISLDLDYNIDIDTAFSSYTNVYNIILYIDQEIDLNLYIDQQKEITCEV